MVEAMPPGRTEDHIKVWDLVENMFNQLLRVC